MVGRVSRRVLEAIGAAAPLVPFPVVHSWVVQPFLKGMEPYNRTEEVRFEWAIVGFKKNKASLALFPRGEGILTCSRKEEAAELLAELGFAMEEVELEVELIEEVVCLPPPPWLPSGMPLGASPFYCFRSEAEALKKGYVESLLKVLG